MDKIYDHTKYEKDIYKMWEESGSFKGANEGDPYTILMPPPNANASLHAGQAMYTIDDIMIRFKRMQGYSAVWIPGRDHAGIETQFVYEKFLAKQGKSRMDFDRKTLYKNIFDFVDENSDHIFQQFRRLGFSADWGRSVYSLDTHVLLQVTNTFKKMEAEGMVFRSDYLVNFCTHCGTSLAELEVVHEERVDPLYYMKYGPFELATVRPETKFGDTAVAVHPNDKRYQKYIGQVVEVDGLIGKFKVKVISDEAVDPEFGTGVVKVTPAHDFNDFEMGKRHGLEIKQVIGLDGRLNEKTGKYAGMKVLEARKKVAEDLDLAGLMIKVDETYRHNVGVCYKCGRVLEPTIIPNWFIRVQDFKKPAIAAVEKNQVKFTPKRFKKTVLDWLARMHDWPISRQNVWGIQIPVWYEIESNKENIYVWWLNKQGVMQQGFAGNLLENGTPLSEIEGGLQKVLASTGIDQPKYVVSPEKPKNGKQYLPETDTFDTWFSSGQWPLVTLGKEEETRLPTNFIGTLADILPFWISRMIMFSLYLKKRVPFNDVYLWSMVADSKGIKMSKSKGNVINPIDLVDKYGADALRMTLLYGTPAGSKVNLSEEKVRGMRNFSNKIWNAARYVMSMESETGERTKKFTDETVRIVKRVSKNLEDYKLSMAVDYLYDKFWHWYCDKCIEMTKKNELSKADLIHGLIVFLKLLHPFMPFVTEVVWGEIKNLRKYPEEMLITTKWPKVI